MVEYAGTLANAVHRPHRGTYIDTGNTQPGRDNGANGAAAAKIGAVGVLLAGHAGPGAERHEAGRRFARSAVALVGIALDDRAGIDQCVMAGLVGGREVRVPAVCHVGADEEAARHHAVLVFAIQPGIAGQPGEDIGDEAAAGTGCTFAADFLVIEECAQAGGRRLVGGEQGVQGGMAGGEVVELAVGDELAVGAPQAAFLRVVGVQLPGQQVARLDPEGSGNRLAEAGIGFDAFFGNPEQQRQFALLVEFQAASR